MPTSSDTYVERGRSLMLQGATDDAVLLMREAVIEHPEDGFLHAFLGAALWDTGYKEESIEVWRTSARLDSDLESPRLILSFHLREVGRFDEAIEILRDGLEVCPRSRLIWLREMAQVYCEVKNWSQTITLCDQVLAIDPNDTLAPLCRKEAVKRNKSAQQ